jgi:hypothetical protein
MDPVESAYGFRPPGRKLVAAMKNLPAALAARSASSHAVPSAAAIMPASVARVTAHASPWLSQNTAGAPQRFVHHALTLVHADHAADGSNDLGERTRIVAFSIYIGETRVEHRLGHRERPPSQARPR